MYQSRFSDLAAQLYAFTGDPSETHDLVQEAFLRAWQRWDTVGQYEDPVGWVRRVAWILAMSRHRRLRLVRRWADRSPPTAAADPTDGGEGTFEQRRHYQWRDSQFVQVSGPTVFPGEVDIRSVDLRNWSFQVPIVPEDGPPCGNGGWLSFVGGASGAWGYAEPGISLTAAEYFVGGISRGFLSEPADPYRVDAPDVLVTMTCRGADGRTDEWVQHVSHVAHTTRVLKAGVDGVTGIVSHRIVDGLAEVIVRTAGGEEVRRYSFDSYRFNRVS